VTVAEAPKKPDDDAAEPIRTDTVAGLVKVGGGALFFYGAALFTAALLASYGLVAIVAKAILAEIGLSRLGVSWSLGGEATAQARTLGRGFVAGAFATVVVALLLWVTRAGHFAPGGVVPASLATGLLSAVATSVFEELFFRGLVLRLTEKVKVLSLRIAACGAASFVAALSEPGATVLEAAVAATLGAAFAASWLRERSSYEAMAAHAGWLFGARALFRGGLFELTGTKTLLGGLGAGPFTGAVAWAVAAAGFVLALVALRRAEAAGPPKPTRPPH